jgi:fumarylacetoacetase
MLPQSSAGTAADPTLDPTLDPTRHAWLDTTGTDFPIQNLPFGVFQRVSSAGPAVGVAIGSWVLDLAACEEAGVLRVPGLDAAALRRSALNDLIALGPVVRRAIRERVFELLVAGGDPVLQGDSTLKQKLLVPMAQTTMLMPVAAGDFVDFYSSLEHATNVGTMFRDASNPLLPNWKHIPIGYHGRSSSLYVSGQSVIRPMGQLRANDDVPPVFAPSKQLDFELEMGFVVGCNTQPGQRVAATKAFDAIFGMVVVNDWSARDIQKWEYVPLGPFLGKSFATTVSPWVVTIDVVQALRVADPARDVPILPYLEDGGRAALDIDLEVTLKPEGAPQAQRIAKTNFRHMYWTIAQQLAHMSSNGTPIRVGDLYASGTVSGTTPDAYGSMLELCWKGTRPLTMLDGSQRTFVLDGDTITMKASASLPGGVRIGFGDCSAKVLPALPMDNTGH